MNIPKLPGEDRPSWEGHAYTAQIRHHLKANELRAQTVKLLGACRMSQDPAVRVAYAEWDTLRSVIQLFGGKLEDLGETNG